jgi:hypothetical protein
MSKKQGERIGKSEEAKNVWSGTDAEKRREASESAARKAAQRQFDQRAKRFSFSEPVVKLGLFANNKIFTEDI